MNVNLASGWRARNEKLEVDHINLVSISPDKADGHEIAIMLCRNPACHQIIRHNGNFANTCVEIVTEICAGDRQMVVRVINPDEEVEGDIGDGCSLVTTRKRTERGESMYQIQRLKKEIEQMIGISTSDAEMFWDLSKKCAVYAGIPAIAAGAKWGPGMVSLGTVALPGLGTVSGTTAALLMVGGVWGSSYGACMSILPGLMEFRDTLRTDQAALSRVRSDVRLLLAKNRLAKRA